MQSIDLHRPDFRETINEFQKSNGETDRYASFDYCYRHFHPASKRNLCGEMEKSCLALGFYLASWGMLRGSSFLLNKSAKYYQPLIEYIEGLDASMWKIDVNHYNDENIETITTIYKDIEAIIIDDNNASLTLVTKIMLGVFGFIPAFDNYFGNTFRELSKGECGFRRVNSKALKFIGRFYQSNKKHIDRYSDQIQVKCFDGDGACQLTYPKAKIIDMYGFSKGLT